MQTSTDATSSIETHAKHHEAEISMDVLCYATSLVCYASIAWTGTKATSTPCRKPQVHIAKHSISNATRPSKGSPRSKETMV